MFSFKEIRLALMYMVLTLAVVVGVLSIPFHYWAQNKQQIAHADTPQPAVNFPRVNVIVNGKSKEMTVQKLLMDYLRSEGQNAENGNGVASAEINAPHGC